VARSGVVNVSGVVQVVVVTPLLKDFFKIQVLTVPVSLYPYQGTFWAIVRVTVVLVATAHVHVPAYQEGTFTFLTV
jgi:hypothetical protein